MFYSSLVWTVSVASVLLTWSAGTEAGMELFKYLYIVHKKINSLNHELNFEKYVSKLNYSILFMEKEYYDMKICDEVLCASVLWSRLSRQCQCGHHYLCLDFQ